MTERGPNDLEQQIEDLKKQKAYSDCPRVFY